MPDAARIAQAQAREVPVVLKGAHDADESGKRELFTENATTVLVFENGAVLHLRSKLAVGQTVFIHNAQNGREVLCKVLEAPEQGGLGLTDLEFTAAVPDFWDANSHDAAEPAGADSQDSPAADQQNESHVPSGKPGDDSLAMMLETASKIDVRSMTAPNKESGVPDSRSPLREELMAAHEMAPDASAAPASVPVPDFEPAATTNSPAAEPTGEQIDAALKQMSGAAPAPAQLDPMEPEPPPDEKHLAALMARDARLAKFAAFKEKQAQQAQKDGGAKEAGKEGSDDEEGAAESKPKLAVMEMSLVDRLTTGKNATYSTIAVGVLVVVAFGVIWHSIRGSFVHPSQPPTAVAPTQPMPPAPATIGTNPATASPATSRATVPTETRQPSATPSRPSRAETETAPNPEAAGDADAASRRHRRTATSGDAIEPAEVLSQPQPTLPLWAVGLQVDGVVKLDALIDEKGNVAETRVLSGPRALQREAERAIGLWVFEPARADGKAIPSHLTLSVGFLPPKR